MATLTSTEIRTAAAAVRDIAGDPSHPLEGTQWVATNGVFICPIQGDVTTDLATTQKFHMRAPFAFTVTDVKASLHTAAATGTVTFDINNSGTSLLSTKLTIDATETTSLSAAAAYAFDTAEVNFAADDELSIDVDDRGTTGCKGAVVYIYYQRTA